MKPLSGFGEYRRLFWCVLVAVAGDGFDWPAWRVAYFAMTNGQIMDNASGCYIQIGDGPRLLA